MMVRYSSLFPFSFPSCSLILPSPHIVTHPFLKRTLVIRLGEFLGASFLGLVLFVSVFFRCGCFEIFPFRRLLTN